MRIENKKGCSFCFGVQNFRTFTVCTVIQMVSSPELVYFPWSSPLYRIRYSLPRIIPRWPKWAISWDYGTSFFKHACVPVGLDVSFLVGPFVYFHTSCVRTAKVLARLQMRRLAWAFAGRLCNKYHNLVSWLKYCWKWHNVAKSAMKRRFAFFDTMLDPLIQNQFQV